MLAMKHRLALPVGGRDMPALVAGLAGVPRVHGHPAPTLVLQALGQLAPVASQDAPVQAGLGLDVGTGLRQSAPGRLCHRLGGQGLSHKGVGLVRQRAADMMRVIVPGPLLLAAQLGQLAPDPPRPYRALALARTLSLLARHLGLQATQVGHAIYIPIAVGDLSHIPIQPQCAHSRAHPYRVRRHLISEVDVPFGPHPRAFFSDARLPGLAVGIQVAALHPQPAYAGHAQLLGSHLYASRDGEAVLPGVLAIECGVRPLTPEERRVGIRQVLQDIAHFGEAVLLQPGELRVPPQRREFFTLAEEDQPRRAAKAELPPTMVRIGLALQKVFPDPPAGTLPANWNATCRLSGNSRNRTLGGPLQVVLHCAAGMEYEIFSLCGSLGRLERLSLP